MKRWLVKIIVFLLLGAIVNVAVAWVLAIRILPWWILGWVGPGPSPDDPPTLSVHLYSSSGATIIEAYKSRLAGPCVIPPLPSWSLAHTLTTADLQRNLELVEHARGWPCITLYWRRIGRSGTVGEMQGGILVGSRADTALPLIPIWPGFAINTLFYAAILWGGWMLFAALPTIRRRRRIKRGLCPACAYPVGVSDVCTECGKPVRPRSVEPVA